MLVFGFFWGKLLGLIKRDSRLRAQAEAHRLAKYYPSVTPIMQTYTVLHFKKSFLLRSSKSLILIFVPGSVRIFKVRIFIHVAKIFQDLAIEEKLSLWYLA